MALKIMETSSLVRSLISAEDMDSKVSDLADYSRRDTLVQYSGKINPTILSAWSMLLEGLEDAFGEDAIVAEGLAIYKVKTRAELEELVVQNLRSDRYWNPEKYADITEDMIKPE